MEVTKKRANLKNVAERAGVSLTTASYVLNNRPSISEGTMKRVWDAKRELDYQPNLNARNLRKGIVSSALRTNNIGLIIIESRPNDPIDIPLIKVFSKEVQKKDCHPMLLVIPYGVKEEGNLPLSLREKHLSGFLLTGILTKRNIAFFDSLNIPFVVFGSYNVGPEISLVKPDVMEEVIRGMNHLFSLGHRKIGLISEILDYEYHKEILKGYREAYRRKGLKLKKEWIQQSGEIMEGGYKPTEAILKLQDVPSALFVTDHRVACGVIQTLQKHGIIVGKDISVITLSGIEHSNFKPHITQMKGDMDAIGKLLVKTLCEKISNPEALPLKITVPCMFEEGQTCGPKKEVMP